MGSDFHMRTSIILFRICDVPKKKPSIIFWVMHESQNFDFHKWQNKVEHSQRQDSAQNMEERKSITNSLVPIIEHKQASANVQMGSVYRSTEIT